MRIVGIDPGASGALVILNEAPKVQKIFPFRKILGTEIDMTELPDVIRGWWGSDTLIFMEDVHALPRDASKYAFVFGENTGIIKGLLFANKYPFEEIFSQKWQRHFGLGDKYPSKTARKNAQKAKAQELFPDIKVTLDIADALLIARYGYDTMSSNS